MNSDFVVCFLFSGDHLELVRRCLEPWCVRAPGSGGWSPEIRIGLNDCSKDVRAYADEHFQQGRISHVASAKPNIYKYPMMRRLLYDKPLNKPFVIWFDQDTYLPEPRDPNSFMGAMFEWLMHYDVVGHIRSIPINSQLRNWMLTQPWQNTAAAAADVVRYPVGDWWAARTLTIKEFDWPSPALAQYGGDVMLGLQLHALGRKIVDYPHVRTAAHDPLMETGDVATKLTSLPQLPVMPVRRLLDL